MLVEVLVWLGVVFAACIAWLLYNGTDTLPEDQQPPRRDDLTRRR